MAGQNFVKKSKKLRKREGIREAFPTLGLRYPPRDIPGVLLSSIIQKTPKKDQRIVVSLLPANRHQSPRHLVTTLSLGLIEELNPGVQQPTESRQIKTILNSTILNTSILPNSNRSEPERNRPTSESDHLTSKRDRDLAVGLDTHHSPPRKDY